MPIVDYIQIPTVELINHFIEEFDNNPQNIIDERAVRSIFETYNDRSLQSVYIKTILLNNRYSAGLNDHQSSKKRARKIAIDVLTMASIIHNQYEDCSNIHDVIDSIERINRIVSMNYYSANSFISKYYYWAYSQNEDISVPIYDGYVKGMTYYLGQKLDYLNNPQNESVTQFRTSMASYSNYHTRYMDTLRQICEQLGVQFTVRQFDKYLWTYGKSLNKEYSIDIKL